MKNPIIAIGYDYEHDDYRALRADGASVVVDVHGDAEMREAFTQYKVWFARINDMGGPFCNAWAVAVDKFLGEH